MLGAALVLALLMPISQAQTLDPVRFFETKIRPIFATKCSACHGEKIRMASLQLTTAEGFLKGTDSGPVVVPGDPDNSRLIHAVGYRGKIKMPPSGKLEDSEIQALRDWVKMGAAWPAGVADVSVAPGRAASVAEVKQKQWAFQPIGQFEPPAVKNQAWVKTPIDNFILAKLEEKGLVPAKPADKLTLLRRAKFDLHGLPPTEREIQEFMADAAPNAFAKLIDRLLAAPQYGEQWGRHWLDVARYADPDLYAWRYRDYVIDAFNKDLPYDQFVREQVAGDLLDTSQSEAKERQAVATGFLALGPKATDERDKVKMVYDAIDENIDTLSKAFLGLTISCARCHDHKFDPITNKDYYSLASVFASTKVFRQVEQPTKLYYRPLVPPDVYERYESHSAKIKGKQAQIDALLEIGAAEYQARVLYPQLADYMMAARKVRVEKVDVQIVARQMNLDDGILKKWVDYLKPGFRPFLLKWYETYSPTASGGARLLAEEYQKSLQATARQWSEVLKQWREGVDQSVLAGKAPPEIPSFEAFKDRFFAEVSLADKTYEESIANGPLSILPEDRLKFLSQSSKDKIASLRRDLQILKAASPPEPPMAAAVTEGESVEQPVFIRGNYQNRGDIVPKRFPVIFGEHTAITNGSGRKELSTWLTQPNHPLTSRVAVNRIWQWHFGEGLVRTANNFGAAGERPTHPELLDYLARQFVKTGWSIKEMHRLIMLSNSYQMSSRTTEDVLKADADNRLWSRFNRRRLTADELRDSLLALDGSLDLTVGGRLHDPVLEATDENERENSRVNPDDYMRRTVYLPLHRSKLPTFLNLFDFGDASQSAEKRPESNTAPQALYLMNSDFVHKHARSLAESLVINNKDDDAGRVNRAYLVILGREAAPQELASALKFLEGYPTKATGANPEILAWQSFCKTLLLSNEFQHVN
jgi:hypothetical protein